FKFSCLIYPITLAFLIVFVQHRSRLNCYRHGKYRPEDSAEKTSKPRPDESIASMIMRPVTPHTCPR
ncbi:MAG: hypothetical protein ACJ70Y_06875, partial [Nitrososphaera sp.]